MAPNSGSIPVSQPRSTKKELQERKTNPDVSPTGRIVVLEDPTTFHYGHREGNEYRRIKAARPDGMTDEQFAQFNDQASLFQVEPPNLNLSHQDEEKGPKKGEESEDDYVRALNRRMKLFTKNNP